MEERRVVLARLTAPALSERVWGLLLAFMVGTTESLMSSMMRSAAWLEATADHHHRPTWNSTSTSVAISTEARATSVSTSFSIPRFRSRPFICSKFQMCPSVWSPYNGWIEFVPSDKGPPGKHGIMQGLEQQPKALKIGRFQKKMCLFFFFIRLNF